MGKLRLEDIRARLDNASPPPAPTRAEAAPSPVPEAESDLRADAERAMDVAMLSGALAGNLSGTRIGAYRIERELGRGGMGTVVLASRVDNEFTRKVAIKLLYHTERSEHLLSRFRNERQILASLDHPNIARMFDGGATENGEPYFVMEYVRDAQPITDYCVHREMPIRRRLELFLDACAAVQYAHRFLIVHRDLKPSNILVSGEETVKLMDFGIAKNLLAERLTGGAATLTVGMQPMTPAYASPEQVRGEPISTSSDVYSLGIVLYELLAGCHPFLRSEQPLPDLLRSICETEPVPPSLAAGSSKETQAARPKDDLDRIVLMAIRKDAARRYGSVEQFAEDIRRYLDGQPVIAHHDSHLYRWRKFLVRNRMGVGAVAMVILSLVGGIVSTRAEQARTQRRLKEVRELANSLVFEVNDGIKNLPGSTPIRALIVNRALTYLDRLSRESNGDPAVQRDLAEAYRKIGDIQFRVGSANLGDAAGAVESARKELQIREALDHGGAKDLASRLSLAEACERFGEMLQTTGQSAAALPHFSRALKMREELIQEFPKDLAARMALALSYRTQGDLAKQNSHSDQALVLYQKALSIHQQLAAERPEDHVAQKQLSMDYVRAGDILGSPNEQNLGRPDDALTSYHTALEIRQRLSNATPSSPVYQRDVANVYQRIGSLLRGMKRGPEALENSRRGLAIYEKLNADDPANLEVKRDIAVSHSQIAWILERSDNLQEAIASCRKAAAIYEFIHQRDAKNSRSAEDLASTYNNLGQMLLRAEDLDGASSYFDRSIAIGAPRVALSPRIQVRQARNWSGLASVALRREDWAKATELNEKALRLLLDVKAKGPLRPDTAKLFDGVLHALAESRAKLN